MSDFDEQERRIARILGEGEVPEVNNKTLRTYLAYLKKNLEFPCYLTGIEDFSWEERYVFGYGSKAQYEELKKVSSQNFMANQDTYAVQRCSFA